ncbi:hypothetical protein LZ30DRAFT_721582 [Colletotrichum cereale]|nr:hypothetical protein LZ30DRAFT_721582 [Colletotrichum cereale]
MRFSQLPAATALLAFFLPSHLMAQSSAGGGAECELKDVPLSTDWSISLYTFTLDPAGQAPAEQNGINTIQLSQFCQNKERGWGKPGETSFTWNAGYANLTGFGPDHPYTIQVPRCEKGKDRQPAAYRVQLCVGDPVGAGCAFHDTPWLQCGPTDDYRGFCPIQSTKAVNVTDPVAWTCDRPCTYSKQTWGDGC